MCHLYWCSTSSLMAPSLEKQDSFQTDHERKHRSLWPTHWLSPGTHSVRITFLMASLNDLDISVCDISGAYLNAPLVWGKGFGSKPAANVERHRVRLWLWLWLWHAPFMDMRAQQKHEWHSSSRDLWIKWDKARTVWQTLMSSWRRNAPTKVLSTQYWSYMLVYIDDCLLIDDDSGPVIEKLKKEYRLKNDAYRWPDRAIIDPYECTDCNTYWSMSPRHYLKKAHKFFRATSEKESWRDETESTYHKKIKTGNRHIRRTTRRRLGI